MRIVACINPHATINPTGEGKHVINMLRCLAAQPDVQLSLLVPPDQLESGRLPADCPLQGLPFTSYPFPRRVMNGLWQSISFPKADRWCVGADWLYCPTEIFVPVRRASFASTIHCVNWFEPDLPWYRDAAPARRHMKRVLDPVLREARVVLTVSDYLKGRICELFQVDARQVAVVGNGVETCYFEASQEGPVPLLSSDEPPYLLAVAPPLLSKGFDYLLQLADELARRKSELKLKVAGAGLAAGMTLDMVRQRWGTEVASLLEQALARPNVELLGYQGSAALVRLMRQSVALVILSRYETFGIPAVEAMAAGVPVIAGRLAALPEIVGDAGILLDPTKSAAVADVAMSLLEDSTLRIEKGRQGAERARQFTWGKCASKLVRALQEAA